MPNPDPPSDSVTATIVKEQEPYMVRTYARPPLMLVRGEGCYVWDVENRRYLDFTAGIAVNALGHCDPELSKLIAQQVSSQSSVNQAFTNIYHDSVENINAYFKLIP